MSYKHEERQWLSVVQSELWDLPLGENSILPALRLSYFNLPSRMKQCFAYCAVFPKDYVMDKDVLIQLWMANGFIPFNEKLDPEAVGREICEELCWRSFLEDLGENYLGYSKGFKMHDLVHDLAKSIMEDVADNPTKISPRTLHYSSFGVPYSDTVLEALYGVESLRTFLMSSDGMSSRGISIDFSKLSSVRVLAASYANWPMKLSSPISCLKHLRYLDLSHNYNLCMLPESICSLCNLQTLNLNFCKNLRELPEHMRRLKNLRHLYLDYVSSLSEMPPNIGQITCLKTLTRFIVGKKRGCHLDELKGLINLEGKLSIEHLERVENLVDAMEANLLGKKNLRQLYLYWREDDSHLQSRQDAEKVLEALKPPVNLKELYIFRYQGAEFPTWMSGSIIPNVVSIEISYCHNCSRLPPLASLPCLQSLCLQGMREVVYIDDNSQNDDVARGFLSLKRLKIGDLPSLQSFSRENGREMFPCLVSLDIMRCRKLMTLPNLPSVQELYLTSCTEMLLRSISNLKNLASLKKLSIQSFYPLKCLPKEIAGLGALESLEISWCNQLESIPEQALEGLKRLKHLRFDHCGKLTSLSEGLKHLTCLETLTLSKCNEMVALPDGIKYLTSLQRLKISGHSVEVLPEALQYVPALQYLYIYDYPNLASLPHWLGDLTSLQTLDIWKCPMLSSLPASMQNLTKLQRLRIVWCSDELEKRCEKERGEYWYKIAHIPHVSFRPLRDW